MSKADSLRSDFARAVERLAEACARVDASGEGDDLLRDGLIQRFEFSFELAWKAVQASAVAEGVPLQSPKRALAYALRSGWIVEEELWLRMLEARNLSSHTYNEEVAAELARTIPGFLPALRILVEALRSN